MDLNAEKKDPVVQRLMGVTPQGAIDPANPMSWENSYDTHDSYYELYLAVESYCTADMSF